MRRNVRSIVISDSTPSDTNELPLLLLKLVLPKLQGRRREYSLLRNESAPHLFAVARRRESSATADDDDSNVLRSEVETSECVNAKQRNNRTAIIGQDCPASFKHGAAEFDLVNRL
jgi:ribonucleotide monophosphatase NagD (HAD superfamily)